MRRPTHYASLCGELGATSGQTTVYRFLRYAASMVAEKPVTRVQATAHGYEPQTVEIPVALGTRSAYTIRLKRDAHVEFGRVRVRAEWEGGSPFSGSLTVLFQNAAFAGSQGVALTFEDGWADEEFMLPTGTYSSITGGSGPTGAWWQDPGPLNWCTVVRTLDDQSSTCRVLLRGATVRVRVESPSGAPVRGYGLAIVSPDGHGALLAHWHQEYSAGCTGAALPDFADVLVPAGRYTCFVTMPDGRQGHAEFQAGRDGDLVEVSVVVR